MHTETNDPAPNGYPESPEQASEYLRLTLPLMSRHGIAPNPHNFAVWYEYAAGRNQALKQVIDGIVGQQRNFSAELNQELYRQFFTQDERSLEKVRRELRRIIVGTQGQVRRAGGDLSHYCEALEHFANILDGEGELEVVGPETELVLQETRSTEQSHRALDERLASVVSEVELLRRELEQIREESLTDSLTGIGNRKAFDASLAHAIRVSTDKRAPLSVLMVDIDHFKAFNDSYGHLVGDRVLRLVAATLRKCVKGYDKPSRFGGEEFTVILPNTSLTGAVAVAEQIRREVAAGELRDKGGSESYGRITVSVGVAQFRRGETETELVNRVDQALYRAKQRGRNRVAQAD